MSKQIVAGLNAWRDARDRFAEGLFLTVYGSPALQAAVGVNPTESERPRRAGKSVLHREFVEKRLAELKAGINDGGLCEASLRALIYVGLARGPVDERGADALRRIRLQQPEQKRLTLQQFEAIAREQFFMLIMYPEEALAAIERLLPDSDDERRKAFGAIREVLTASGQVTGDAAARLSTIARLFGVEETIGSDGNIVNLQKAS